MEEIDLAAGNLVLFVGAVGVSLWAWGQKLNQGCRGEISLRVPVFQLGLLLWVFMVMYLLMPQVGYGLAAEIFPEDLAGEEGQLLAATLFGQLGLLLVLLVFFEMGRPEGMGFPGLITLRGRTALGLAVIYWGRALPLVWLTSLLWMGMLRVSEHFGFPVDLSPQEAALWIVEADSVYFLLFAGIMVVVLAPIVEEILFRGFLYPVLAARVGERLAFFASSVLFGLIHANLQNFLALTLLGCLLAHAYRQTRDIRVPIFFHAFFNAFTFANLLFISL